MSMLFISVVSLLHMYMKLLRCPQRQAEDSHDEYVLTSMIFDVPFHRPDISVYIFFDLSDDGFVTSEILLSSLVFYP